ncbi:restriction endonuclease subunit S [Streptomyces globosus]|uniref:restriction endonuclease subunit S n=1 Tax=Streptomyces globosus TaxID=68209 RepID=UPI00382E0A4B
MSDWQEITLGWLFSADNSKLGAHTDEPTVMSLSKYDGFIRSDDYFDKRIASEKLDGYKTVEPGEWAYSTIHIDEGSIARNNLGETGVISPMYTTLRWCGEGTALPEYAELLVRSPRMLAEYTNNAQGSVNRRRSLPFKTFSAIPITLPPLAVQERIVEIICAVDDQITALDNEARALDGVYRGFLLSLGTRYGEVKISEVVSRAFAGGTPSRSNPEFYGGDIPWLKSGEVENDSIVTASEFITEAGLQGSNAKMVPPGATVVAMYGQGDTKGRAGFVEASVATNQAVLALVPDERLVLPRFLLHAVRSKTDDLRHRAVGSSQPNLSKGLVVSQTIPMPDSLADQERALAAVDSVRATQAATLAEADRLRTVRASLVSGLLDRTINIESAELEV